MGFGQAAVSVPTQLADQGKAGRVFAHCLVGDSQPGGGSFIIGNILEPDIAYTPQITGQYDRLTQAQFLSVVSRCLVRLEVTYSKR